MKRDCLLVMLGVLLVAMLSSVAMAKGGHPEPAVLGPVTYIGFDLSSHSISTYDTVDEAMIEGKEASYNFNKKESFKIKQAIAVGIGEVLLVSGDKLNTHYKDPSDCKKINAAIGVYCRANSMTVKSYRDVTSHLSPKQKKLPSNMVAVYICK